MSGIATLTARCVAQVPEGVRVAATRKTTPGFRKFEKKAVKLGGGDAHRYDLSSAVMIKDNHIAIMGIEGSLAAAKKAASFSKKIEVEVESVGDAVKAAKLGADIIMFDNMTNELMGELVKINDHKKLLEASGNMTLKRVHSVAMLGVDYISVGALTHSYKSLDISLKFQKQNLVVK
jgi:nicotinate-nucleotide pyrophosphorylase (carboxylating)